LGYISNKRDEGTALMKPKEKYWYKFHYKECVLCGQRDEWKERMFTPKPESVNERHIFEQYACDYLFL